MNNISINQFLSKINFKQVAFIELVSSDSAAEDAGQNDGDAATAVRFINASILLTGQPLDYFWALAHGRMLDVPYTDLKTGIEGKRLVPLDAIHHLQLVPEQDKAERTGRKPAEARIVYRAYDPAAPARLFQIPIPVSLIDDLMDRDEGGVIDIGGGKFVFANEVENARPLEPKNIARLAQCEDEGDGLDKPPVSIIELSDGAIIPSPFHVQTVEGMVQRPLPSACPASFRHEAYREAGLSA